MTRPVGGRFSHVYLERGEPTADTVKASAIAVNVGEQKVAEKLASLPLPVGS